MSIDEPRLTAGWYPDPDDPTAERWWNGSQWTSHSRQAVLLSGDAGLEGESPRAWSTADAPLATLMDVAPAQTSTAYTSTFSGYDMTRQPSPPAPLFIQPGWYPDPSGVPAQRWWDGAAWSEHTAPAAGFGPPVAAGGRQYGRGQSQVHVPYGSTTVVMVAPRKSVGVALVLTFFFGPFGMFYSTVSGALIMLAAWLFGGVVVGIMTFGLGWLVWWPAVWLTSMIWGCVAAGNQPSTPVVTSYR